MSIFDNHDHDPGDEFDGNADDRWEYDDPNYDPEPLYDDGPQLADDDIGSAEYDDFFGYDDIGSADDWDTDPLDDWDESDAGDG